MSKSRTYAPANRMLSVCVGVVVLAVAAAVDAQDLPDSARDIDRLTVARAALEDQMYDVARQAVESYLEDTAGEGDENEEALVLLLRIIHRQQKPEEILRLLAADRRWGRDAVESPATVYWRALARYELGQAAEALSDLDENPELMSGSAYAGQRLRLRAWCLVHLDRLDEAATSFSEFTRQHENAPEFEQNLLEWGQALLSGGQLEKAAEVLKRLSDRSSQTIPVLEGRYWYGLVLFKTAQGEAAAGVLQTVGDDEQADADLRAESYLALAEVREAQQQLTNAVAAAVKAQSIARDQQIKRRAQASHGRFLLKMGQLQEGTRVIKAFVAAVPDSPDANRLQLMLASALLEQGQFENAVEEYQNHLESFTNRAGMAEAYFGKGLALAKLERHPEAAGAFEKAYSLYGSGPQAVEALFRIGDALFAARQYPAAAERYLQVTTNFADSPLAPDALFQVGACFERGAEPRRAEENYRNLIERFPESQRAEEAYLRLAALMEQQSRLGEAIQELDALMGRYTNSVYVASALNGRGLLRCRLYRFGDALNDFSRVLIEFPDSSVVEQSAYMRAMCHYWLSRDDDALRLCDAFLAKYPESRWAPSALFWSAELFFNRGEYDLAGVRFAQFVEKHPAHPLADAALLYAAWSSYRRNEYLAAKELATRLIKEYPKSERIPEARFTQAESERSLGNFAAAILIYEEISTRYPEHERVAEAWLRRGDSQFVLGGEEKARYEDAVHCYEVVARRGDLPFELLLEAEYKVGRCYQKLGRVDDALQQYYTRVILRYLDVRQSGRRPNGDTATWFTRAAFNAADINEGRREWKKSVRVLERVIEAGVPAAEEASRRVETIKSEHWWLY